MVTLMRVLEAGFSHRSQDLPVLCRDPTQLPDVLLCLTCMLPIGHPLAPWSVQGKWGHLSLRHNHSLYIQNTLFYELPNTTWEWHLALGRVLVAGPPSSPARGKYFCNRDSPVLLISVLDRAHMGQVEKDIEFMSLPELYTLLCPATSLPS